MITLGGSTVAADSSGLQGLLDLITNPDAAKKRLAELTEKSAQAQKATEEAVAIITQAEIARAETEAKHSKMLLLKKQHDDKEAEFIKREEALGVSKQDLALREDLLLKTNSEFRDKMAAAERDLESRKILLEHSKDIFDKGMAEYKSSLEAEYQAKDANIKAQYAELSNQMVQAKAAQEAAAALKADYESRLAQLRQLVK